MPQKSLPKTHNTHLVYYAGQSDQAQSPVHTMSAMKKQHIQCTDWCNKTGHGQL